MISGLLLVPAVAGILAFLLRSDRARRALLVGTAVTHLALVVAAWLVVPDAELSPWLRLDAVGALFLLVTSGLFAATAVYAVGYLAREERVFRPDIEEEGSLFSNAPEAVFTGCLLLFLATMTLVTVSHHLVVLWVAVEATTLASAPLIFFHRHHRSLEATWKYLLICSVGIAVALLGNFFLALSASFGPTGSGSMVLSQLIAGAPLLHERWLKAAFILLLVGYGTKMGLAPLHTWLPDAHAEAPSVVSALLSGALLNCAFLGILRAQQVVSAAGLGAFAAELLTDLGLLSMATAAVFIVAQPDFKRLLAYSSVEHMGILAVGVGVGGCATFGALLHAVNHSLAKGMLFLLAGNILAAFRSKSTTQVRGVGTALPFTAALWVAGLLAITGVPPFGPFVSELLILKGAVDGAPVDRGRVVPRPVDRGVRGYGAGDARDGAGRTAPGVETARPRPVAGRGAAGSPGVAGVAARGLGPVLARPGDRGGRRHRGWRAMSRAVMLFNGERAPRRAVPVLPWADFERTLVDGVAGGARVAALFGMEGEQGTELVAVLADPEHGAFSLVATVVGAGFASLTPVCPQVHLFEREIGEQLGLVVEGHPWFKPVRFHRSWVAGRDAWGRGAGDDILPSVVPFFAVDGDEVHEVAVGPVHAGVIEPGHFRFNCHGERVIHLEISLGYQHRGVERSLVGGPGPRTIHQMETCAGDSTVAHATAFCQVVEALAGVTVPARAQALRAVALELERMANHVGDLGALAGDVGFLPTAAYCGRLRGDLLNLTALLCGSRFGRGLVRPGGVRFDVSRELAGVLLGRLEEVAGDVDNAVKLMFDQPSVQGRFDGTGTLSSRQAVELGLVGLAARACGLERDARHEFPWGMYRFAQLPVSTWHSGDVFARAWLRWLEVQRSTAFVREQLAALPEGGCVTEVGPLASESVSVSMVEGWRGEVCHLALTGGDGRFARYKVVDPSFHNWLGLALAMRGGQISDFPLCNKSFNLSYCGHDL